jgi:hypothetical protein
VHTDDKGAYQGPFFTSGLFVDVTNDVFYGMLLTGMPQGSSNAVELVWTRLGADGNAVFAAKTNGAAAATGTAPSAAVFQAGGDTGGGLHGIFSMKPKTVDDGVYCYGGDGSFAGASAANIIAALNAKGSMWVTPENQLALLQPVTTTTNLGCSTAAVPSGGGMLLAKSDATGQCLWNKVLAIPTASLTSFAFRAGADGSLDAVVAFTGTIDFGSGALHGSPAGLAIARFDSGGALAWAKSFTGSSFTAGTIGVNAAGTMVVTSGYTGAVNLGGGALPSSADTFVAVFDSTGTFKWSRAITVGSATLIASPGKCGVAIATTGTSVDFGTGTIASGNPPSIGIAALGF